jgi:hypothetical protein
MKDHSIWLEWNSHIFDRFPTLVRVDFEQKLLCWESHSSFNDLWEAMIKGTDKKFQRIWSGRLFYIIWNVWKEKNRRIFNGMRLTHLCQSHTHCSQGYSSKGFALWQRCTGARPPDLVLMWVCLSWVSLECSPVEKKHSPLCTVSPSVNEAVLLPVALKEIPNCVGN